MDHEHMHENGGMAPSPSTHGDEVMRGPRMMMHMTFYWGTEAAVLFTGWPGRSTKMYAVAVVFIFVLSVLVEWLSASHLIREDTSNFAAGMIQTVMHAIRVGLAYIVMLALMSFNGGIFLAAVAGHTLGFMVFGNRVFKKRKELSAYQKPPYIPEMSC